MTQKTIYPKKLRPTSALVSKPLKMKKKSVMALE
jgi:hypothetical protein